MTSPPRYALPKESNAPDAEVFFEQEHAIAREVWQGRPYVRWTMIDATPVQRAYAGLQPGQRAFLSRCAGRSPGWIITRHTLPEYGPIYPEIRPDWALLPGTPYLHYHGAETLPEDESLWPVGLSPRHVYRANANWSHITETHGGVNDEEPHTHEDWAKYLFAPGYKHDVWYVHEHAIDSYVTPRTVDRLAKHLHRYHDGVAVTGPHPHRRSVTDRRLSVARRLDIHPMAQPLLDTADTVYFGLEGCLKADAILSRGAAVVSVPSVTLWRTPELDEFAENYLAGRRVVVVFDADWATNPKVKLQALLARKYLLDEAGAAEVLLTAPPTEPHNEKGDPLYKGVDDFLAAGIELDDAGRIVRSDYGLDDLHTVDWVPSPRIGESRIAGYDMAHWRTREQRQRDCLVLLAMSLVANEETGRVVATMTSLAQLVGCSTPTVVTAIESLHRGGALRLLTGGLRSGRSYWSGKFDWLRVPEFEIPEPLRAAAVHHTSRRVV